MGEIGYHFPREVIRVERDYSGGELVQYVELSRGHHWPVANHYQHRFYPTYPLEFEGRVCSSC